MTHKGLSQRSAARYRLRQVARDAASYEAASTVWLPPCGDAGAAVVQAGLAPVETTRRVRRLRIVRRDERPHPAIQPNHVWTYDILYDRLANGRLFKTLSILDEFTRECLAIHVAPSIRANDVSAVLQRTMQQHGHPQFLRSDNGSEFTATAVQQWLHDQQVGPRFIQPGHPWQNGFIASFHGKFRDECLNREWFTTGHEAAIVIEQWRKEYTTQRPHSALGYQTPAHVAALSTQLSDATLV